MGKKASSNPFVLNKCFGHWKEVEPRPEYQRCAGRPDKETCEVTSKGNEASCVWVIDPKGPQGSYCRGSSEVIRS